MYALFIHLMKFHYRNRIDIIEINQNRRIKQKKKQIIISLASSVLETDGPNVKTRLSSVEKLRSF